MSLYYTYLTECCKRWLNHGSFVLLYFLVFAFQVVFSLLIFLYCFVCQYQSNDWLWRPPPKWPRLCQVRRWTLFQLQRTINDFRPRAQSHLVTVILGLGCSMNTVTVVTSGKRVFCCHDPALHSLATTTTHWAAEGFDILLNMLWVCLPSQSPDTQHSEPITWLIITKCIQPKATKT